MHSFKSIKVIDSGKSIILKRNDDTSVRFHSTWLRDNALDQKTRDVNNKQRLITLSDIPINISIKSAKSPRIPLVLFDFIFIIKFLRSNDDFEMNVLKVHH